MDGRRLVGKRFGKRLLDLCQVRKARVCCKIGNKERGGRLGVRGIKNDGSP